jgi:hypothetical protein
VAELRGEEVASLTGENCHYGQSPFYEKVVKVKADLAAHLAFLVLCGLRRISAENFALGSLRSDDWQLGRPAAPPVLSVFRVFSPPNASFLPCCIDPGSDLRGSQGRPEGFRASRRFGTQAILILVEIDATKIASEIMDGTWRGIELTAEMAEVWNFGLSRRAITPRSSAKRK